MSIFFFLLVRWVESGEREWDGGGAGCRRQCVYINGHGDSVRVDARQDGLTQVTCHAISMVGALFNAAAGSRGSL